MNPEDLTFSDFLPTIAKLGKGEWTTVYSFRNSLDGVATYSALIKNALVKRALERPSWDLSIGDGAPGIESSYRAGRERTRYVRASDSGIDRRDWDAIQLSRGNVSDGKITLRTEKNGKRVSVPMHPELEAALKKIGNGKCYFWSGSGKVSSAVSDWHRTIERLVRDLPFRAHSHRFRHSLAAELISLGTPIAQVAAILGNTPSIVEKVHAQFIDQRQKALDNAVRSVWA
jgi:integrase